jgi:hypothetical protein
MVNKDALSTEEPNIYTASIVNSKRFKFQNEIFKFHTCHWFSKKSHFSPFSFKLNL